MRRVGPGAWLALLLASGWAHAERPRFALAVASSEGRPGQPRLWFPSDDARRMAAALTEVGGFDAERFRTLVDASAGQVRGELDRLVASARAALARGEQPLLLFYYSGHAGADGLELGREVLPYSELRDRLTSISGAVALVILDACHSGALTQVKGAKPAPLDFEIPASRPGADGLAILTSSSASEVAQESASLGGSFFTHHLALGLRGAADSDGDGRVTLAESYRYAYHRTLAATSSSGVAPQHPTYSLRLAGKGEVVLSDLRRTRSALVLAPGAGRLYLVSREGDHEVMAEVSSAAAPVRVALPAGRYRVERLQPAPRLSGTVALAPDTSVQLEDSVLEPVLVTAALAKGDFWVGAPKTFVGAEGWLASPILQNFGAVYGGGLTVRHDEAGLWLLASLSYSQKDVDDVGYGYTFRAGTVSAGGAFPFRLGKVALLVGAQGSISLAWQRLDNGTRAGGLIVAAGPTASLVTPLTRRVWLRTTASGNVHSFVLNGAQVFRGSAQLAVAIEVGL